MNLQQGYKVIFEGASTQDSEAGALVRNFFASKTEGYTEDNSVKLSFVDAAGAEVSFGDFALVYEKDGALFGSVSGIPTEADVNFVVKADDKIIFGNIVAAGDVEDVEEDEEEEEVVEPETEDEEEVVEPEVDPEDAE